MSDAAPSTYEELRDLCLHAVGYVGACNSNSREEHAREMVHEGFCAFGDQTKAQLDAAADAVGDTERALEREVARLTRIADYCANKHCGGAEISANDAADAVRVAEILREMGHVYVTICQRTDRCEDSERWSVRWLVDYEAPHRTPGGA